MDSMDGMPQMWHNREDLLGALGDDDDVDALNDETFGDCGWDDPAPIGDISDLSAMTLDKAGILQEAAQRVPQRGFGGAGGVDGDGADGAFPSLPMGSSLLGGPAKPMTPAGLMTPQMMMQSVADSKDKASFFSSSAEDRIVGGPRPGSGGPVGGGGAHGDSWSMPSMPQSVGVGGVGMGPFGGGMGGVTQGNHYAQHQHQHHMQQQQAAFPPPQQQQRIPQPQMGGSKVMSLADIEAQMMAGTPQQQQQQNQQQHHQQHMHQHQQQMHQQMLAQQQQMYMQQQMLMQQQQQHQQQLPPHLQQQMQQAQQMGAAAQQHQGGGGGGALLPGLVHAMSLDEIMREEEAAARGQPRRMQQPRTMPAPTATPATNIFSAAAGNLHTRQWKRMTMDEVNFIIKMHQGMLRDAAATDVYYTMLLAKQGWRANFSGPLIGGRTIKLSEALEGALGRPAPKDLRRPRQLVKIEKREEPKPEKKEEGKEGEGAGDKREGEEAAVKCRTAQQEAEEAEARGVPAEVSALPRAVRRSIEDAMLKMLSIHDVDKIHIPDPATLERRGQLVNQMYELWHVTSRADKELKGAVIGADMNALNDCHSEVDVFFFNLILIAKGSKVVLRCLHMLSADRAQDMLMHMLRCLLPMAYCVATKKNGAGMELLVQLLVKLVYTMDLPQLLSVLEQSIMNTYSDGGMHLLMCTKLGALALAALLRRGHEEYMKDESQRTEEDNAQLMLWAAACQKLTARMLGGLDALFVAATQGTNTALPPAMITDSEILVDLVYELGANANLEQRSEISQRLAACALRTGSQEVQAQVSHLLLSLNWTA